MRHHLSPAAKLFRLLSLALVIALVVSSFASPLAGAAQDPQQDQKDQKDKNSKAKKTKQRPEALSSV